MKTKRKRALLASNYVLVLLLNILLTTVGTSRPTPLLGNSVRKAKTENASQFDALESEGMQMSQSMSFWQFMNKIIKNLVAADDERFLDELESTVRAIVVELDKQQSLYGNDTVVYTTTGQRLVLEDDILYSLATSSSFDDWASRDTGDIFQRWLEKNFNVAYQWAKSSPKEEYRLIADDFKAARDWIRGFAAFNHFTNDHVDIVVKFVKQTLPAHPAWRNLTTSDARATFKQYLRDESASWHMSHRVRREIGEGSAEAEDDFGTMALDDEFRSVFMKHRNLTNWWDYILTAIDYIEDAVVTYNRLQTMLWPPKMAISFAWPPLKFIWTGIDVAACLFEEFYELVLALETEERWWDVFLCSMEVLGVIPGGGAVKFGLRIAIRLLKFITGIHTVPWYITMPWGWFKGWWWPDANETTTLATTTTKAAVTFLTTRIPTTTKRPATSKPSGDPYNWNRITTKASATDDDFHWGDTTRAPVGIIGAISVNNL